MKVSGSGPSSLSMPTGRRMMFRFQWIILWAFILVILGFISYNMASDYRSIRMDEQEQLSTQAGVIAESVASQLNQINLNLEWIIRDYYRSAGAVGGKLLNTQLETMVNVIPGVRTMLIIDAQGNCIAGSTNVLIGRNFSNRMYFQDPLKKPDETALYIPPPYLTVLGVLTITVSRMIPGPDGQFAGVAVASLDPGFFGPLMKSVLYSADMRVTLVHGDGMVFMTMPFREEFSGIDLNRSDSAFSRHMQSHLPESVSVTRVLSNDNRRLVVQRTIQPGNLKMDRPLVVMVSRDLPLLFASWRRELALNVIVLLLLTMISTAGLLIFHQRMRKLDAILILRENEREQYRQELEQKVRKSVQEIREKDHLLIKQSRQAAMGETIGNIAHQWRQPLNALGLLIQNVSNSNRYAQLTDGYISNFENKAMTLIQHMSQTIDDFRNYFKPDREIITFSIGDVVRRTCNLVESNYQNDNISLDIHIEQDVQISGFPNELGQVLLILIDNARDALKKNPTDNRKISIGVYEDGQFCRIRVADNGGGIPAEYLDQIFDPYFTTKENGTGIGLYMSRMLIEKQMGGKLLVGNTAEGAEFTIVLKK